MKKLLLLIFALVLFTTENTFAQCSATITPLGLPTGCGNRTLTASPIGDLWTQKASMISNRAYAAGFSIGTKGYIGTGATTSSNTTTDFWEYDMSTNSWSQKANFPGTARIAAVGFSIGNKGYMGTGVDLNNIKKSDFYEYNPVNNTWTAKASITGARSYAVGFSIGTKGYVGTGYVSTSYVNDFYEFDPVANTWTAKTSFGGVGRHSATGFSIGTKGYIGFGSSGSAGTGDFWEYNPTTNLWSQKAGIYGMQMFGASGFALGNKGYMVGGKDQGTTNLYSSKTYQYDPITNLWREMASIIANAKNYAVAFTIGGKGYVGTGSGGNSISQAKNVLYEYEPWANYLWSNSATTQSISVVGTGSYSVLITTAAGCTTSATQTIATSPNPTLTVSGSSLVCSASSSTLNASGASSYTWSANAGGVTGFQAIVSPTISTTYTVSGTSGSCTVSYPVSVLVGGAPFGGISVSGPTVGCGVLTLGVNPGGDTWSQKANMIVGHQRAIGFSIGTKGYLGTGTDGGTAKDFWEYDPVTNAWTQKADFAGGNRFHAYNFAIGGKGYAGGGYNNLSLYGYSMDFWEYDPITNAWTRKGDVPMTPRFVAVSLTIGNKGYVGTGQDNYGNFAFNDFWEYDPTTDLWTQKANVPTVGRAGAAVFSIGNKGYLGSGYPAYPSTTPFLDFWEFNPLTNSWTAIAPFPGGAGGNGVGFTIGNKGYVTSGSYTLNPTGLWEYNQVANTWIARANFPGSPRPWSVAFVVGNKAYMGSGPIGSTLSSYNDLWQYEPAASILWSTSAITPSITVPSSGSYSVNIQTVSGCSVASSQSVSISPNPTITVSGNPTNLCGGLSATLVASGAGSYTWSSSAGGSNSSSVIVTPTASTNYTVSGTTGVCTVNYPITIFTLPVPSTSIAVSGPTLGCGMRTLSVNAPPLGWTQKANLSITRRQSSSFSIGNKAYVGLGQNLSTTLSDFWEYDPQLNTWTQKANFAGGARYEATGFSINAKGYVAGGYNISSVAQNDFWEYDPLTNIWTQKASLSIGRAMATGFGLNGKGYVGLGEGLPGSLNDFWEYNPANNSWTQKANYGGGVRTGAASFTIGLKGYVGAGYGVSSMTSDFWEYDPTTNIWTSKTPYGGGNILSAKGFGLNNKGYFVGGSSSSIVSNAVWEYDPSNNTWTQKLALTGGARTEHVAFSVGNKGYAGMGFNVNVAPYYYNDLWEFDPGSTIVWSTSSTLQAIPVALSGNYSVSIINSYGCSATSAQSISLTPNPTLTVSGIPSVLCAGSSGSLTVSGASTYTWSPNSGGGNNTSVIVSPTLSTSYTVSGTSSSCTVDYPINIFVSATPVATIASSGPTLSCGSLNLSVNSPSSNWTQKAGLTVARTLAVSFSVGTKGYLGLGGTPSALIDFWEYDPNTNAWTQKANFTGGARTGAAGFSIGAKGYVAAGFVPSGSQYKNDLWEFDPTGNTWSQKTSFTGVGRQYCTGFALNGKGYVGLGTNSTGSALGDFWEYNPTTDVWLQKANFIGPRTKATSFVINSLAYVGTGMSNTALVADLWAFDPVANSWIAKAAYPGTPIQLASGFALGNKGYIGLGTTGVNDLNAFWEYNSITNTWSQKGNFSGAARQAAGTFIIGSKAYIATGYNSFNAPNYKNDLWEFQQITSINWSTGSTLQTISTSASGNYSVTLTNLDGCSASSSLFLALSPNPTISVSGSTNLMCGGNTATLSVSGAASYTWSANAGSGNSTSVIVTPSVSTSYTVSGTTGSCTIDYPVYVGVITPPSASILPIGSTTICGAAITLSTNAGVSNIWTQKTSITTTRNYPAGFSINGKGYVGTGLSGTTSLSDLWEYDPTTNSWSQKANFGGGTRYAAVGMSIGNKGYIGTGFDGVSGLNKNDFWEYNPMTNTWTEKANFGGAVRKQAAGFSIGNKGYLGAGWDGASYKNDFYEYNPATNVWTQKANISSHRYGAFGVSLGSKGYIGGGSLLSSSGTNEFWEYDPIGNSWTQLANIGGPVSRIGAVGFAIGNAILVTGGTTTNDTWEYNSVTNIWTSRTNFSGPYRSNSTAFVIDGKGYVACGSGSTVYNDLWEYYPITSILWSTSAITPSILVSASGTYSVLHTNIAGCSSSAAQAVSITPIPTVSISGLNAICNGSTLTFTANGANSYTWSANAGSATTTTVSISPTVNTSYVVTGAINGCTANATKNVTVNAVPLVTANTSTNSVCQGFNITLNGGGATTYTWTGGAINNTSFIPASTTDYTVTGSSNNCTNTAVVSVTVNPSPSVTVNSGSVCAGESFTLNPVGAISYTYSSGTNIITPALTTTYTVIGVNAIGCTNAIPAISIVTVGALPLITANNSSICVGSSYTINPNGAATYTYSSGSNVVTPANTTTYGVTGTSSVGCVSANQTILTVTVNPLPTVSVSSGTLCNGQSYTLNPVGAVTYTYLPGGSAIVSPNTNTTYTITGTNVFGCESAVPAIATINVLVSPTVSVNSGSICAGNSFTLLPSGAVSYTYSGGSDIVSPASTNVYTVTGFNSNGCQNAVPVTATVTVHALPVISANSGVLCAGSFYTINPSGAASYSYTSGSNIVSPAITTTYGIAGSSSVGCVSAASVIITVTVSALPLVSVNSGSICSGNNFTIIPSGAVNYTYLPGNSAIVNPNTNTSYSITGANAFGCISTSPAISSVTVFTTPVVSVNSGSICDGSSFTLIASGANSYTYSSGTAIVFPNATTVYSVSGLSVDGCPSASPAISTVTVYAKPIVSANNGTICSGQSFTMSPAGALTYTYSSGSNIVSPSIFTTYTISGSSSEGCLSNIALVTVSVQPAITLSISGPTVACEGQSITLTTSGANSYTWNTGANTSSITPSPISGAVYLVNGTSGVCTASASQVVSVLPSPSLTIVYSNPILCAGDTATITASGAELYTWNDGSTLPLIVISPTITTSFTLTGMNMNGCNTSSVLTQQVSDCTGINELGNTDIHIKVYPNPNYGLVTITSASFPEHARVELYDYLGQLIFSEFISGTETQVHFGNSANGMYTLKVSALGKVLFVTKLIKQ